MRRPAAAALPAVAVAALAALPLAYLVIRSAGAGEQAWDVLARERTLTLVASTAGLVALVVVAATVTGVALAWLVERSDVPGRRVLAVAAALPLVIPSYVLALALIAAVGPGGLVGGGAGWIFGLEGAWLALTLATYPYVYLLTAAALRRADPSLEEAARGLGRSRAAVFREVTLPVLRPSIGAGALLCALYALSDFGVVSLMRYDALTRAIFQQYRALFDRDPAAVLGLVLVVLTVVVLIAEGRGRTRGRVTRQAASDRPAERVELGRWRAPAACFAWGVVAIALVLPLAVLVSWAARDRGGAAIGELVEWAGASVFASALAALAAVVAALPVAWWAVRRPGRASAAAERVVYAANALPGIVIALALVFFATRVADPLYQTLALLVFAYVVRFLPQALGGVSGALSRIDPRLEQAARGLGASPARVALRVTAPLLAPGMLAGATLVFLSTMKELPATLLLRPIGFDTLATEVWSATTVAAYSQAALPALVLVAVSAPVVWALQVRGAARREEEPVPGALAPGQ